MCRAGRRLPFKARRLSGLGEPLPAFRFIVKPLKMKTILLIGLGVAFVWQASAQYIGGPRHANASSGSLVSSVVATPPPVLYMPRDPDRVLDGVRCFLRGTDVRNGWVQFEGTVIEVQREGIRLRGWYTGNYGSDGQGAEFFLTNFPYAAAENEKITVQDNPPQCFVAHVAGVYTYNTVGGSSRTIRMLDYGSIYTPTAEEIAAAAKVAAAERKAEKAKEDTAKQKALKANQQAADEGDAYGLMRMGERYRDGDGVDKDLIKARVYLQRAVDAGSPTAVDDLKKLPDPTPVASK